jgi:hypothetical protein
LNIRSLSTPAVRLGLFAKKLRCESVDRGETNIGPGLFTQKNACESFDREKKPDVLGGGVSPLSTRRRSRANDNSSMWFNAGARGSAAGVL